MLRPGVGYYLPIVNSFIEADCPKEVSENVFIFFDVYMSSISADFLSHDLLLAHLGRNFLTIPNELGYDHPSYLSLCSDLASDQIIHFVLIPSIFGHTDIFKHGLMLCPILDFIFHCLLLLFKILFFVEVLLEEQDGLIMILSFHS